ncbi:MAG TPA: LURP-one-related family protein [Candidatus Bathyarchaeia archaeon]|nr:LURP-one-related family protein [Candidatus Bathyarchaeia archaeon]
MSTGPVYGSPNYAPRIVPIFNGNGYIIEQKILALRDTFGIKDQNGNLLAYVKKQLVSFGPKFWYETPDGQHLGEIHGKVIAIRPTFEIYDGQGQLRARVKKKILKLLGEAWWMEDSSGNEIAKINGKVLEHDYYMQDLSGGPIAQIHKKWVSVRDSYGLQMLNPTFDPYLAISYAISLDNAEKREDKRHPF